MSVEIDALDVVAFDADDTLWHSENRFHEAHRSYHELLAPYVELGFDELEARMLETERSNLRLFGYGAKGFTLSLIETAIQLTDGRIGAADIERILAVGKDLLDHPVELLPGVAETIEAVRATGTRIALVTKGDLWHQESKVAASGIAEQFAAIEIVSEKDAATYRSVLGRLGVEPGRFCMIGNSVRSDVLPVVELGGSAIHVPYEFLWAHEAVDAEPDGWIRVDSIREVPTALGI